MKDMNRKNTGISPEQQAARSDLSFRRTIRVLSFLMAVGLIVMAAGFACRTIMNRAITTKLEAYLISPDQERKDLLKKISGGDTAAMFTALIRNDFAGFIETYSVIEDDIEALFGNPKYIEDGSFLSLFLNSVKQEAMTIARGKLLKDAGRLRPALEIAAYYREMIIAGAAVFVLALLAIHMKGARMADLARNGFWVFLILAVAIAGAAIAAGRMVPLG